MIEGTVTIDLSPLEGLRKTLVSKIMRKAITQASKIVQAAVKTNAQAVKLHGFTAKSIGVRVKVYSAQLAAVAIVGPRSKWYREQGTRTRGKHKGAPIVFRPSYTAHLIEKGTKRSTQRAFLQPALTSTNDPFLSQLALNIEQGVADQLNKK
jgi:hypothetical protein